MLFLLKRKILNKYPTLGAFCEAIGIKQPRLSEIIHDKRKLRPAEQQRWAKILRADKEELFKS